jgi:hypothetical protein
MENKKVIGKNVNYLHKNPMKLSNMFLYKHYHFYARCSFIDLTYVISDNLCSKIYKSYPLSYKFN